MLFFEFQHGLSIALAGEGRAADGFVRSGGKGVSAIDGALGGVVAGAALLSRYAAPLNATDPFQMHPDMPTSGLPQISREIVHAARRFAEYPAAGPASRLVKGPSVSVKRRSPGIVLMSCFTKYIYGRGRDAATDVRRHSVVDRPAMRAASAGMRHQRKQRWQGSKVEVRLDKA